MTKFIAATGVLFAVAILAQSQEKKDISKERPAIERATTLRDREVAEAKRLYDQAIEKANKKLLDAYEQNINYALKRGGSDGLESANQLTEEKKRLAATYDKDSETLPNLSREKLMMQLTSRTWFHHWDRENRDTPFRFFADGSRQDKDGKVRKDLWHLEQRWILLSDGHLYVMVDDNRFRGFFLGNGREIGLIADPVKK